MSLCHPVWDMQHDRFIYETWHIHFDSIHIWDMTHPFRLLHKSHPHCRAVCRWQTQRKLGAHVLAATLRSCLVAVVPRLHVARRILHLILKWLMYIDVTHHSLYWQNSFILIWLMTHWLLALARGTPHPAFYIDITHVYWYDSWLIDSFMRHAAPCI